MLQRICALLWVTLGTLYCADGLCSDSCSRVGAGTSVGKDSTARQDLCVGRQQREWILSRNGCTGPLLMVTLYLK